MSERTRFKLYFAPGTCARVPLIALEEIGEPFDTHVVKFLAGEHRSPEYLSLNPKGKVPLLLVDGEPLTENVAIIHWLAREYPGARLLPQAHDSWAQARILADIVWCASGLHPIVTRLRLPQYFCETPDGQASVWRLAAAAMEPNFQLIEHRLAHRPWMLGEWSVVDAYIFWVWFRVTGSGFDGTRYPRYENHARRMAERPSVARALERERQADEWLRSQNLAVNFSEVRPHQ